MRELRDEMTRRAASIHRRNEWLDEQIDQHRAEIAGLMTEREANTKLAAQYQQVLSTLHVDEPPARAARR